MTGVLGLNDDLSRTELNDLWRLLDEARVGQINIREFADREHAIREHALGEHYYTGTSVGQEVERGSERKLKATIGSLRTASVASSCSLLTCTVAPWHPQTCSLTKTVACTMWPPRCST